MQKTGHGRFPRNPATNVTPGLMEAIEGFQRDFSLKRDSVVESGGPTEGAIRIALTALDAGGERGFAAVRDHFQNRARAGLAFRPDPDDRAGMLWRDRTGNLLTDDQAEAVTVNAKTSSAATPAAQSSGTGKDTAQARPGKERDFTPGAIRRGADEIARRADGGGVGRAEAERIQIMKDSMQKNLDRFDRNGLTDAAANLRHYLSGSGTPKIYSRDQALAFPQIREAVTENTGRFEATTFLGESGKDKLKPGEPTHNKLPRDLKTMKDGQSITFWDNWDIDRKNVPVILDTIGRDRNFALAFGETKVKANGEFKATRHGDRIEITGIVTHDWDDKYDFHNIQPGAAEARVLEPAGEAAPFKMGAKWQRKMTATVEIRNGKLMNPKVTWTEIDPPK